MFRLFWRLCVLSGLIFSVPTFCAGQKLSGIWQASINDFGVTSFGTPAIDHGQVFFATDRLRSYDRLTGRLLWSGVEAKLLPAGVAVGDRTVYVAESRVSAVREADGSPIWSVNFDRGAEFATPAITGEKLFVGTDQGRIVALDSQTGKTIGELNCDPKARYRSIVTGLSVHGNTLYISLTSWDDDKGLTSHGLLVATDLTGTIVKWTFRSDDDRKRSGFTGGIYPVGTDVLVIDGLGNRVYRVASDGRRVWAVSGVARSFRIAEPLLFVGGMIVMGSADANVYAIDPSSGQIIWRKRVHGSVNAIAHCGGGIAVFDTNMSVLTQAGEMAWGPFEPGPGQQFSSGLVVDDTGIIIAGPQALYSLRCSQEEKSDQ